MKQPKMRKGAVMMEYVILAVMIAAAALVAIIYFGKTIAGQAQTASMATAGQSEEASGRAAALQKKNVEGKEWIDEGSKHADKFNDLAGEKKGLEGVKKEEKKD